MKQNYTSAETSINAQKLPAVYRKIPFGDGKRALDYGCGRYINHLRNFANERGSGWKGYDPFNYPTELSDWERFDIVICSNVLNVIDSDEAMESVVRELSRRVFPTGECFISIYEGNGSGEGRPTKRDCYQRNQKTREYVEVVSRHFKHVRISGNVLICSK